MDAPVHQATYDFDYDSAEAAAIVERSIRQEIGEIDDDRSSVALERTGRTVRVDVAAADLIALRAATNTWLSLVGVAEETCDVGRTRSPS
ncbi:KEOPS complex subunit Pcc1 [Natronoarchaeum philippinense]|uniref:KEOPS complex subunit Pcc1 n=1 Tax=Natronoarchaeum philippinense TaxID=558529 RepID=A0A285P008_NATPI|nr:KEOPS complex subunit Pcc1 [Natronoarchaeum philippinense]SNZ13486.1 KEOPS complex subunit Pcc1 [Natronoarchaeum philippinense]